MRRMMIEDVAREKLAQYPALGRRLSMAAVYGIAQHEGIVIRPGHLPYDAQLVQYLGEWTILVDRRTPARQRARLILHELAHLWLHHDPHAERGERLFTYLPNEHTDVREIEVELFIGLVTGERAFEYDPAC